MEKLCPICKRPLTYFEEGGFYVCSEHQVVNPINPDGKMTNTIQDDTWCKDAFTKTPLIIGKSYEYLYELVQNNNVYGVFLETKDVLEICLKLPTILAIAYIWNKNETFTDEEKELFTDIFKQPLSLGGWHDISIKVLKHDLPKPIKEIIQCAHKNIYNKQNQKTTAGTTIKSIVNWRNERVGHGALFYEDDEEVRAEIKLLLSYIKDYFTNTIENYSKIVLSNDSMELVMDEQSYKLNPFIHLLENDLYFFDSYDGRKAALYLLDYVNGKKTVGKEQYQTIKKATEEWNIEYLENSIDETYRKAQREVIDNKLDVKKTLVKPQYLMDWLNDCIENNKKGVFHLQMERGMGKSTFARMYNPFGMNVVTLPNTSVRLYSIYAATSKANNFLSSIHTQLLTDVNGELYENPPVSPPNGQEDDTKKAMAEYLNAILPTVQKINGTKKLFIIIDGLDEMDTKDNKSIYDFIPLPDDLDENIYILLTSRTDKEVDKSSYHVKRIKELSTTLTDSITYLRDCKENINVLNQYVDKHIGSIDQTAVNALLSQCEYRMLYLKLYSDLNKLDAKALKNYSNSVVLLSTYMNAVLNNTSSKYTNYLKKLFAVLVAAPEPMDIYELSLLFDNNLPTFRLLALLTDLRSFLRTDRTTRGTVFAIHDTWIQPARELFTNIIEDCKEQWESLLLNIMSIKRIDFTAYHNYGYSYLAYNMLEMTDVNDNVNNLFISIKYIADKMGKDDLITLLRNRRIWIYRSILNKYTGLMNETIASIHLSLGYELNTIDELDSATRDYDRAIEIRENLAEEGQQYSRSDLSMSYMNRGIMYGKKQQINLAIEDYSKAIKIQEQLVEEGQKNNRNALAMCYMNRGNDHNMNRQLNLALKDYNRAIGIQEKLEQEGQKNVREHTAKSYMNRGVVYRSKQEIELAIEDYNRAIKICEQLVSEGQQRIRNDLAMCFMNRGSSYWEKKQINLAIEDYNRAIKIRELLVKEGQLYIRSELAMSYVKHGNICIEKQQRDIAIHDYNRAIIIQEQLVDEGQQRVRNELAMSYMSRGDVYKDKQLLDVAIDDYSKAMNIRIQLVEEGQHNIRNGLAMCYIKRGVVYDKKEQHDPAIKDLHLAINILDQLVQGGKQLVCDDLAMSYAIISSIYLNNEFIKKDKCSFVKSKEYYEKSVQLLKKLPQERRLVVENILGLLHSKLKYVDRVSEIEYEDKKYISYMLMKSFGIKFYLILKNDRLNVLYYDGGNQFKRTGIAGRIILAQLNKEYQRKIIKILASQ